MSQIELPVGVLFGDEQIKILFVNQYDNEIKVVEQYWNGRFRRTKISLNGHIMMVIDFTVRRDKNNRLWFGDNNLISAQIWR